MEWNQLYKFEEYRRQCNNNSYKMSTDLSKKNRNLCNYYKKCIIGSEAFGWIFTGKYPKNLKRYLKEELFSKTDKEEFIDEELCYIEDEIVRNDVRTSLFKSIKKGYLIYNYRKSNGNEFLKSRVRVLSKMIWDGLRDLEWENKV